MYLTGEPVTALRPLFGLTTHYYPIVLRIVVPKFNKLLQIDSELPIKFYVAVRLSFVATLKFLVLYFQANALHVVQFVISYLLIHYVSCVKQLLLLSYLEHPRLIYVGRSVEELHYLFV